MLYFAYASNLSKDYMISRCKNAIPIKKATLKGYRLVFNQLADIVKEEDAITMGAIYMVSKQELHQLDMLEGYPDLYNRVTVEVEDDKSNKYDVLAYIMVDKDLEEPPDHYYNILINGYEDWELPLEHLEEALQRSKEGKS